MKLDILNKIVNSITKDFVEDIPLSTSQTLRDEIDKVQEECDAKKENTILTNLSIAGRVATKTKIPLTSKFKVSGKKPLVETYDILDESFIINKFQNKEIKVKDHVFIKPEKIIKNKPSTEINVSGRRALIVNDSIFLTEKEKFKADSTITNESYIADPLRGRAGRYWTIDDNNLVFLGNDDLSIANKNFDLDFQETTNDKNPSDFGRTVQIVALEAEVRKFQLSSKTYSKDFWKSYIHGTTFKGSTIKANLDVLFNPTIKEDTIFQDHAFDMSLPLSVQEIEKLSGQVGTLTSDIEPNYNFLIEEYESLLQTNKKVHETTLPNLYVILCANKFDNPNPDFNNLISLGQTIVTDTKKLLSFNKKGIKTKVSRVYDLKNNSSGEYFDLFGRQYQKAVTDGKIDALRTKFSNLVVSADEIDLIQNFNDKKELFPLYVDIKFSTDKTTTFTQMLKDTNLIDIFTTKMVNRIVNNKQDKIVFQEAIEVINQKNPKANAQKSVKLDKKENKVWDLADLLLDIKEGNETLDKKAIYLGDIATNEKASSGPEYKFFRSLNSEIFQSKLQTLIKQKLRTYEQIMNGELAYSETVLYRIAKFLGNGVGSQPIQNIFIPNATKLDVLNFIDTQVKYNTKYTYVVYAYQFVVGNKYWYSDVETESYNNHASFKVYQEPSLKLVEVPYCEFTGRVLDTPPAPPDVKIIGYKGIDNKILFLLNNSVNSFKAKPIQILPTDKKMFADVKEAQRSKNNLITFGGDDRIASYEIFRLEEKPTSYEGFKNNLHLIFNTDISLATIQKATGGGITDNLHPNTKYYYIFRAKDVHGHISNPSPLYEVEIVNEHGTIFPIVKIVEFKDKFPKVSTKTMRRFIQIVPTIMQSLIDEKSSGINDKIKSAEDIKKDITLSLADEKVWGKKFKIRLTSKLTGKKIEFDVNFKHEHVNKIDKE